MRDKNAKSKLTNKQFEKLNNQAITEIVHKEVNMICKKMGDVLIDVMRENRISEQRTVRIIDQFYEGVTANTKEITENRGVQSA